MSSNIRVQRICQHCNNEFTARTTVTKYCGDVCSKRAYKARMRAAKIKRSNNETNKTRTQPIEQLKAKEFLTVPEVAKLLGCSVRSVYYFIQKGKISAINLGERMTRVQRTEIDKLFQDNSKAPIKEPEPKKYEVEECYTLKEVQEKYGVGEATVQQIIKRFNIPRMKLGWYAYVPKEMIDKILT